MGDKDNRIEPSMDSAGNIINSETVQFHDVAPALEFMCWTVVALTPFLRWVNGPAVTTDQFVVQVGLVVIALVGAFSLRFYHWRQRKAK
jgi:hypothetical protein